MDALNSFPIHQGRQKIGGIRFTSLADFWRPGVEIGYGGNEPMAYAPIHVHFRVFFRALRTAWALGFYSLLSRVGLLFTGRDENRRYRWRCWIMRSEARGILRACGVRWIQEGQPPTPPFLMVSNHLGYLDIVMMCATTPAWFISKKEVANWPGIGFVVRSVNTLFVDRERKADLLRLSRLVHEKLDQGGGVIFYPEGTSSAGEDLLPFKPSLLEPAASRSLPVHYASITYRTPEGSPPAHEAVCWWGDMDFFPHLIGLMKLPEVEARITFGAEPLHHPDRKILANQLRNAIKEIFTPVVQTRLHVQRRPDPG
jgi:1-acyl-sn-glycerol-3-phosphate acyltransferase